QGAGRGSYAEARPSAPGPSRAGRRVHVPMTLDHLFVRHRMALIVAGAALLAFGAMFGLSWAAGFANIAHRFLGVRWTWVPIALGAEALSYLGYIVAYREVTRAEGGHELRLLRAAALVAGGFAMDEAALKGAGVPAREARARVLGLGALEYLILAPAAMGAALFIVVDAKPDLDAALTFPWIVGVPV